MLLFVRASSVLLLVVPALVLAGRAGWPPTRAVVRRAVRWRSPGPRWGGDQGQTTAEYALVILGAAAIGTLVLTWATKSHVIGKLFDTVVGKILPG